MTNRVLSSLIQRVWQITTSPNTEWNKISEEQNHVFRTFVFPYITICCIVAFWGFLLDSLDFVSALFKTLFLFLSMLGSVCIVWKTDCFIKNDNINIKRNNILQLVVYSFVPNFLLQTLMSFVPLMFFLKILALYPAYVFIKGYDILAEEKKDDTLFIIINIILIVTLPWLLQFICNYIWK